MIDHPERNNRKNENFSAWNVPKNALIAYSERLKYDKERKKKGGIDQNNNGHSNVT